MPACQASDDGLVGVPDLIASILENNLSNVKILLEHGADPNITYDGFSAIQYIVQNNQLYCSENMLRTLLQAGAEIDATDVETGMTAIGGAAFHGEDKCFDLLISYGANPHIVDSTGANVVYKAAFLGNVNILKKAIEIKIDLDRPVVNGVTPIMVASMSGHYEFVTMLLKSKGVNICHRDDYGRTVRDLAKQKNRQKILKILPDCKSKE